MKYEIMLCHFNRGNDFLNAMGSGTAMMLTLRHFIPIFNLQSMFIIIY